MGCVGLVAANYDMEHGEAHMRKGMCIYVMNGSLGYTQILEQYCKSTAIKKKKNESFATGKQVCRDLDTCARSGHFHKEKSAVVNATNKETEM